MFKAEGLRVIATLPKTPRMNAVCERVIGALRRELLDRTLILGQRHLALMLRTAWSAPGSVQRTWTARSSG
jgi:putative transposase